MSGTQMSRGRCLPRHIADTGVVIVGGRQHADDGVRLSIEVDHFADDVGRASERARWNAELRMATGAAPA